MNLWYSYPLPSLWSPLGTYWDTLIWIIELELTPDCIYSCWVRLSTSTSFALKSAGKPLLLGVSISGCWFLSPTSTPIIGDSDLGDEHQPIYVQYNVVGSE